MPSYDKTLLWQKSLSANVEDANPAERERLRSAYEKLRERVKPVSETIARDLPDFTIHDITHLDALWEYADLVAGGGYQLTPCEAFVLGGAFLIHDLGMGLAAYPDGLAGMQKLPLWRDSVVSILRKRGQEFGKAENVDDVDEAVKREATAEVLRLLHAQRAEKLAMQAWKNDEGEIFHLIEDPELRASFGPLIGRIAHSHWWPVDQLLREFPTAVGAPGGFPGEWSVDPLKLACIIRSADFCHLDDRRAPSFVRAIQKPSKESTHHWRFQSKLYQPRLEVDRLVYTAKSAFSASEAPSWWICYDTLAGLDAELRKVDSILADTNRDRLLARGVAYAEDPSRMAKIIRTDGWYPVDTRIRVTAVAHLVAMLGGDQLYGNTVVPPLRELMQNGADAIRARRIIESRSNDWGALKVSTGIDDSGRWIEVEDTGVGMSQAVLTNCLLDFGTSFWGSRLMHSELPGLDSKGYSAVGKYGIGFFSVFMWGDKVKLVTQRFDAAKVDTLVMEFDGGLSERPLMRRANPDEFIQDAGTRVRVWLKDQNIFSRLLSGNYGEQKRTLVEVCAQIAPCLDASVLVIEDGQLDPQVALRANDWKNVDEAILCKRLPSQKGWRRRKSAKEDGASFRPSLTLIKDSDDRIVGRAAIWPVLEDSVDLTPQGVVVIGGFNASRLMGIMGVLFGRSQTAARDIGIPIVSDLIFREWAREEGVRRLAENHKPEVLEQIANVLRTLGVDVMKFPFARTSDGLITGDQIVEKFKRFDLIYIVQDASVSIERNNSGDFELNDNVIVVDVGRSAVLDDGRHGPSRLDVEWPTDSDVPEWGEHAFHSRTLYGAVIEAIAVGWECSLEAILHASVFPSDEEDTSGEIGKRGDSAIFNHHLTIVRR